MPRPADLGLRLQALQAFRDTGRAAGAERSRIAAADRLSRQLRRQAGDAHLGAGSEPGALLALAYPDRVAKRRPGGDGRYLLAAGAGAVLPVDDPLAVEALLVVADLDAGGREGRIRLALPLSEAALRRVLADHIETRDTLYWDAEREAVAARREERLGALVISAHPQPLTHPEQAVPLLTEQIERRFAQALSWSPEARQLQARVALLRRVEPDGGWPDLADAWLAGHLADWLGPWLPGKQSLAEVRALDMTALLLSRLDWEHRRRLDQEAPTALATPAGTRRQLDYTAGDNPVLAVPLQEMFGAATTPSVCSGRVPLTLHLLSPARRPLQITRDLAGFWAGSYTEVRKEMRGRYPKHPWPEDPARAVPVRGGIRRSP